jgi:hypothetical protein
MAAEQSVSVVGVLGEPPVDDLQITPRIGSSEVMKRECLLSGFRLSYRLISLAIAEMIDPGIRVTMYLIGLEFAPSRGTRHFPLTATQQCHFAIVPQVIRACRTKPLKGEAGFAGRRA